MDVPYREDRDVKKLIEKHKKEIEKLKELTQRKVVGYDASEHDDIFMLRYILSNGTAAKSIDAVDFTIKYRNDPENLFYLEKVKKSGMEGMDMVRHLASMGCAMAGFHKKTAMDGGPIQLVRQGVMDFTPFLDIWTDDEMLRFNNLQKEIAWLHCDKVTRETGRLVKLTVINDFRGMRMQRPPSKWMNSFSASSKIAEKMYPQLVETTVLVNTPGWFSWIFSIVKLFLSKRTLSKFKPCKGDTDGDVTACPYIREHIAVENLPSYLGGTCVCEDGCVYGCANKIEGEMPFTPSQEQVEKLTALMEEQRKIDEKALQEFLKSH